jgi:hypothetical protein
MLIDESSAVKHDERARGVLLEELVQPEARSSRQRPRFSAGLDLTHGKAVAIVDVRLTPGDRAGEAGRPCQQVRRAAERSGEGCQGEEDEAKTSHNEAKTSHTELDSAAGADSSVDRRPAYLCNA